MDPRSKHLVLEDFLIVTGSLAAAALFSNLSSDQESGLNKFIFGALLFAHGLSSLIANKARVSFRGNFFPEIISRSAETAAESEYEHHSGYGW